MGNSCGKFLQEHFCGNILGEILAGKCCGKFLNKFLAGKSCRKILQEILAENLAVKSCGTGRRGKSQFKKGSDWWKFSICNRVMGTQPIRIQVMKILKEILKGKSCGKKLWEILAGNSCRNIFAGTFFGEILAGKCCRKFLYKFLAGKSCRKFLLKI